VKTLLYWTGRCAAPRGEQSKKRPGENQALAFKVKVALAALRETRPWPNSRSSATCTPNQITQWKTQLRQRAMELVATPAERDAATPDVTALHTKIGEPTTEKDFLASALGRIPDASARR
jgi:transposase